MTSGGIVGDARDLLTMAVEENDQETVTAIEQDLTVFDSQLAQLEFRRMFSGEMDQHNAFLDIQAGSGGTEAQDRTEMQSKESE